MKFQKIKTLVFHSEYTTLTFMYERLCIFMRFYIIGLIERSWRSHIFILKYIIAEAWKHWVMHVCVWVWCHTIMRPQVTSRWHDTPDNTWSTDTRQRHPRIRQTNELWIEISTDTGTVSTILLRKHSGKQLSSFSGTLCFCTSCRWSMSHSRYHTIFTIWVIVPVYVCSTIGINLFSNIAVLYLFFSCL